MIKADHFYIGVSVTLGLWCVVSIFLAGKYVPDKGAKRFLIVSLVLFAVSGAALAFCQHILRMLGPAQLADLAGVTEGAFDKVVMFVPVAVVAQILEVAAVALCVFAGKKLVSLGAREQGEQPQGGGE